MNLKDLWGNRKQLLAGAPEGKKGKDQERNFLSNVSIFPKLDENNKPHRFKFSVTPFWKSGVTS